MLLQSLLVVEVVVQLVDAEGEEVAAGPSAFIADWRRYQSLLDGLVERPQYKRPCGRGL